jgi:hypothetical protein
MEATVSVFRRGQEDPGIRFEWTDRDGNPIDFSSGYTFTVLIVPSPSGTTITKTTGLVGGNGYVDLEWAVGELDIALGSYRLHLHARDGDDRDRAYRPNDPPVITIVAPEIGA